jgi:hypothetical protein
MAPCDLFNRAALRRSSAIKQIAPHLLLRLFSKIAHIAYGAFHNAESAYQLPHHPLMYGDIFPDDSADDGRGRSKKEQKRQKFRRFSSFCLPGFHH